MPVVYQNNLVIDAGPPPTVPLPVWPTIAQDPRPICCLILGDGFTQDLLAATGAKASIPCTIDDLIPAPADAQYLPVEGDRFGRSQLWDEEKWPRIMRALRDTGTAGREFFKAMAVSNINPTRPRGLWSFQTATLEYELRCYLWHLFRHFQFSVKLDGERVAAWSWRRVLHYLVSEFRLFVVSFNYDLWFEALLSARLCFQDPYYEIPMIPVVEQRPLHPYHHRAGTVLMVKPHGSISYHLDLNGIAPLGANPWLADNTLSHNALGGTRTRFAEQPGFPMIPDLVPPGRQGDDYCNPASIATPLARDFLKRAGVVISCGLSATEPDTQEVVDLLDAVPPDTSFIQVGLKANDDDRNPVAVHAQARARGGYAFFDAAEVQAIVAHLTRAFKPSWKWHDAASQE